MCNSIQLKNGRVVELDETEMKVLKRMYKMYLKGSTNINDIKIKGMDAAHLGDVLCDLHNKDIFRYMGGYNPVQGEFGFPDLPAVKVLVKGDKVTLEDLAGLF